jgi:hypothetical protein
MSRTAFRRVFVVGLAALAVTAGCSGDKELPKSAGEPSPASGRGAEASQLAPMVWLAGGDEHGPMDASRFVTRSELWFHAGCPGSPTADPVSTDVDERKLGGRDTPYTAEECDNGTASSDAQPRGKDAAGFFLDLEDGKETRRGDGPSAPVYWQYYDKGDGRTTAYVYWLFYAYNDFVNNHEGDWERVAVQLVNGDPDGVTFWKHEEPPCRVAWDDIDKRDGHPVTYSARGSHGSYPWEGGYDATPQGPDAAQPITDTTSPGTAWQTWTAARSVVEQPWWGYRGHWGDQTGLPGANGPDGPYPDRREAVFATDTCAAPLPDPTATPAPSVPQDQQDGPTSPDDSVDGAIHRFEQYLHALGGQDIATVCEIAAPAAKKAEDQGFGPCEQTFSQVFGMISPEQREALKTATVDPAAIHQAGPARVEIPATAVRAAVTFSGSDLGDSVLDFQNGDWFITD